MSPIKAVCRILWVCTFFLGSKSIAIIRLLSPFNILIKDEEPLELSNTRSWLQVCSSCGASKVSSLTEFPLHLIKKRLLCLLSRHLYLCFYPQINVQLQVPLQSPLQEACGPNPFPDRSVSLELIVPAEMHSCLVFTARPTNSFHFPRGLYIIKLPIWSVFQGRRNSLYKWSI